jgi:hypothetical protein
MRQIPEKDNLFCIVGDMHHILVVRFKFNILSFLQIHQEMREVTETRKDDIELHAPNVRAMCLMA